DIIATYSAEQVYSYGIAWAEQYDTRLAELLKADQAYSTAVFNLERVGTAPRKDLINWSDITHVFGFFFDELFEESVAISGYPMPTSIGHEDVVCILDHVSEFDPSMTKEAWLDDMRALAERLGFARDAKTFKKDPTAYKGQFGDLMMVVRVGLTARTNT